MAQQTLANAAALLKRVYLPTIRNQLNNANYLMAVIEREKENFIGKEAYISMKKGRNQTTRGTADNAALPSADRQRYENAVFGIKYVYSRFDITGPLMAAAKGSDASAFVNALDSEVNGTIEDSQDHMSKMMFGDGTGALAKIATVADSATQTCDSVLYFKDRIGMTVRVVNSATGTQYGSDVTIDSISLTNKTVTFSAILPLSTLTAVNAIIIKPNSYQKEINGLDVIVDTGNVPGTSAFQGLDRTAAANLFWQASVLSNGGTDRPLTLPLMQDAYDAAEVASGGTQQDMGIDVMFTTYKLRNKYASLLEPQKRFQAPFVLEGGWKAVDYNGVPLMVDKYANPGKIYFLKKAHFSLFVQEDWNWMDEDGKMLFRIQDRDGYEAVLKFYGELANDRPNTTLKLSDLDET